MGFAPGTRLVMYTDGITEAANPEGVLFEEDRLESVLSRCRRQDADTLKHSVFSALQDFTAGQEQDDDVTLAIVEYT